MGTKRFIVVCSMERAAVELILQTFVPSLSDYISFLSKRFERFARNLGEIDPEARRALSEPSTCEGGLVPLYNGYFYDSRIVQELYGSVSMLDDYFCEDSDDPGSGYTGERECGTVQALDRFSNSIRGEIGFLGAEVRKKETSGDLCKMEYRLLKAATGVVSSVGKQLLGFADSLVDKEITGELQSEITPLINGVRVISDQLDNLVDPIPVSWLERSNLLDRDDDQSPNNNIEVG